jgi:hypothetical protein
MKSIMEGLNTKLQKFGEEIYKNVGANAQQQAAGGAAPGAKAGETTETPKDDSEIIDADFDMVDDEEK